MAIRTGTVGDGPGVATATARVARSTLPSPQPAAVTFPPAGSRGKGFLPMSRSFRILAALAVLGSCLAAALSGAIVARAATTVRAETALLDAPSWDAGVLTSLPTGAEVVIVGAPAGAFLPVQAGDLSGWLPGAAISADKAGAPPARWEEPDQAAAQPAETPPPTAEELPSVPPAPEEGEPESPAAADATVVAESDPAASPPVEPETPPVVTPAADTESAPAAPAPTEAAPTDAGPADAPPVAAKPETPPDAPDEGMPAGPAPTPAAGDAATAPAGEAVATASPAPSPAATLPTPPPPATSSPVPQPSPTPMPTPEPLVEGPATVATDAPLREWAEPNAPIVFMVPAGSLVNLQGEATNGHVQAEFMWMYGWISADLLQPAAPPEEEAIPADADEEDVRTPRAGSGVAFATVDLTMRAGPSAGEEAVGSVPAGAKVELTGVMQNDFQRVIFQDQIGWIANEFLELPAAPTPTPEDTGKGKSDAKNRPQYSERQIIRIIYDAADRYGQDREDMLRVARCESALDPYAVNPSGSYGLFQFIRSTWKSTPYGDEDIFDPRANANAAGWMWQQGRKSEWVCK